MVLYADTILIPDPVLPWMEDPRGEERFRDVLLLQTVFTLLHLKPLVDADLPYPALIVFPSFERSLENKDPRTRALIEKFCVEVLSAKFGTDFANFEEMVGFATANPDDFLAKVEAQGVFVGPQVDPSRPLNEHIAEYRKTIADWRSVEDKSLQLPTQTANSSSKASSSG
ncbi:MAG: hypothetical protein WCE50_12280 [Candidatus Acidiferrum sp.]